MTKKDLTLQKNVITKRNLKLQKYLFQTLEEKALENIFVGGENATYLHFLPFLKIISLLFGTYLLSVTLFYYG